jgi:hypothetical protein
VIAAHFSLIICMSHLLTPMHVACVNGSCCIVCACVRVYVSCVVCVCVFVCVV